MSQTQELIEQFFHSEQGQNFQREICDKNLKNRESLVAENAEFRKQMKALSHNKECAKAEERLDLAKKELKAASEHLSNVRYGLRREQTQLEKAIRKNEIELKKSAPMFVSACISVFHGQYHPGVSFGKKKSTLMRESLKELNTWLVSALCFDEMKKRFSKMKSTVDSL